MRIDHSHSMHDCATNRAMFRSVSSTQLLAMLATGMLVLCGCATPQKNSDRTIDQSASTDKTSTSSASTASNALPAKLPMRGDGVSLRADNRAYGDSSFNASVINHVGELNSSFAASANPTVQSMTRLESAWSQTFDDSDERLRLGDAVSSSGTWGSSIRYGGVQFGTPDPRADVIASRRFATPGIAALPSAADALLSNARGSSSLGAEGWSTSGSTRLVGANTVSFIAQDALGRTQMVTQPLLAKTVLADPGCNTFSMGFGKVREDYALQSNQYGAMFANTTVRCGVSRKLTVETHGEYLEGQTAAWGVDLASKVGNVGLASAAVASSRGEGESGWLAKIGFEHSNSLFDVALRTRLQSRGFREVAAQGITDPVVQQTLASLGVKLNDANNLAVAYAAQTTAIGERADVLAVTQSMYMGAYGSLSMTAGHSVAQGQDSSVYLFYSRPFGRAVASGAALKGIVNPNFDLALATSGLPRAAR